MQIAQQHIRKAVLRSADAFSAFDTTRDPFCSDIQVPEWSDEDEAAEV